MVAEWDATVDELSEVTVVGVFVASVAIDDGVTATDTGVAADWTTCSVGWSACGCGSAGGSVGFVGATADCGVSAGCDGVLAVDRSPVDDPTGVVAWPCLTLSDDCRGAG